MDIVQSILDDHHEQRRLFATLQQIDREATSKLEAIWTRLAAFLEVHAEAEEKHFYPSLLKLGKGAGGKDSAEAETVDAIKDHNKIRDAVAEVARHEVGSKDWFEAVAAANKENGEHMDEEEREGLADFRRTAPLQLRHELAIEFAVFEAKHLTGVAPVDKDPKAYVKQNR